MPLQEIPSPAAHPSIDFMGALFVFMLASFIGMMVIQRVSRLLHTPLTNAISASAVVGAIIVAASGQVSSGDSASLGGDRSWRGCGPTCRGRR